MINPTVQVAGRITECHLIRAKESFLGYKYIVSIAPFDYPELDQLEMQVEQFKEEWKRNAPQEYNPDKAYMDIDQRKDSCLRGCNIYFESLHSPRLCKELKKFERDEELMYQPVQVLGNLQMHKDGNVYVSAHQVIACEDPSDFDAFEVEGENVDDTDW